MTDVKTADLVDRAEAHVSHDGYDAAHVLACALERLAETWADDDRPLCAACGRRRVPRGSERCSTCRTRREDDLGHKRAWWRANRGADADPSHEPSPEE